MGDLPVHLTWRKHPWQGCHLAIPPPGVLSGRVPSPVVASHLSMNHSHQPLALSYNLIVNVTNLFVKRNIISLHGKTKHTAAAAVNNPLSGQLKLPHMLISIRFVIYRTEKSLTILVK